MIQDLTAAAVNAALANAQRSVQQELQQATGGLNLGDLMNAATDGSPS
jgi:DNA-binding protein YbaB